MLEIKCCFGRPINLTLVKTPAEMKGWRAKIVNRYIYAYLPDQPLQSVFNVNVADTARFCRLIADTAAASPLHRAILEAVRTMTIDRNYRKVYVNIIVGACGGDEK